MTVFDAVLHFHQPREGYRFTADSILLAGFVSVEQKKRVADFGAGCGVVGLSALEKGRAQSVGKMFFVEREPLILGCLKDNMSLYQPRTATELVLVPKDWRELTATDFGGALDYVMVNPPYFVKNSGRMSGTPAIEAARREIHGDLNDLLQALASLLTPQGRFALMLPAIREAELRVTITKMNFNLARLETVTSKGNIRRLILAEVKPRGQARACQGLGQRPK